MKPKNAHPMNRLRSAGVHLLATYTLCLCAARAAEANWTALTSTDWNDATNWSIREAGASMASANWNYVNGNNGGNIPASAYGTEFEVQTSPDLGHGSTCPPAALLPIPTTWRDHPDSAEQHFHR